jgi:hypothetical protein
MDDRSWYEIVAAVERAVDEHAFDDEDGNGWLPIGPIIDALYGKREPG